MTASEMGIPITAFEFTYKGLAFKGQARQRYCVVVRYSGSGQIVRRVWHGMDSFLLPKAVHHVFSITYDMHRGGDVFCIDVENSCIVAHASHGELLYDAIDPNNVYDASDGAS